MRYLSIILFTSLILISGCIHEEVIVGTPKDLCIQLCQEEKNKNTDLSYGPCLSNNMGDWVCDVAHSPRTEADNDPANQCSSFRSGQASHFVEVDEDCNFIRGY